jgi:uncharacterized protein (TIGR02266 family)
MAATPATASAKAVLVADDTAFVRDRFRTALEEAGHRAVTVRTAAELFDELRARRESLDLIVLDLRLPRGNGVQMVREVRAAARPDRPILVFSGTIATADEVRELTAVGVAGYVNEYTAGRYIVPSLAPHLFPELHNRRDGPRVVLGIPVSYRSGSTISSTLTTSISRGGLAVRTTSPVAVGSEVRVRFKLPGGHVEIDAGAEVVWSDRSAASGLRFTSLDPASRRAIDEFVQSSFFSCRRA